MSTRRGDQAGRVVTLRLSPAEIAALDTAIRQVDLTRSDLLRVATGLIGTDALRRRVVAAVEAAREGESLLRTAGPAGDQR